MHRPVEINTVSDIVVSIGKKALLPRFARVERNIKPDGSVVTDADLECQSLLIYQLGSHWKDIDVLGEEMTKEEQ